MKKELLLISVQNSKCREKFQGCSQTSEQDKASFEHQSEPLGGGGSGGMPPQKMLKSSGSEMLFYAFSMAFFFRKVNLGPKSRQGNCLVLPHASYSPALNHMNSVHMYQFHQIERERERLQCSIIQLFIPSCNCYTTKYRMLIS